jgi:hypothetical protein
MPATAGLLVVDLALVSLAVNQCFGFVILSLSKVSE